MEESEYIKTIKDQKKLIKALKDKIKELQYSLKDLNALVNDNFKNEYEH